MDTGFRRTRGVAAKEGEYYVVFSYTEKRRRFMWQHCRGQLHRHSCRYNKLNDLKKDIQTMRK